MWQTTEDGRQIFIVDYSSYFPEIQKDVEKVGKDTLQKMIDVMKEHEIKFNLTIS